MAGYITEAGGVQVDSKTPQPRQWGHTERPLDHIKKTREKCKSSQIAEHGKFWVSKY